MMLNAHSIMSKNAMSQGHAGTIMPSSLSIRSTVVSLINFGHDGGDRCMFGGSSHLQDKKEIWLKGGRQQPNRCMSSDECNFISFSHMREVGSRLGGFVSSQISAYRVKM